MRIPPLIVCRGASYNKCMRISDHHTASLHGLAWKGATMIRMRCFVAAIVTCSLMASAATRAEETKMQKDMHMVAPALEKYTQDRLLGEVWKRPGLSARD